MPATITVTATVQDPSGTALAGNSFVRFRLRNFTGFVPQISGTSILPETQIDATPTNGLISQALWPNNAITPSTTFYTVELWNQGRITSSGNYIFNTSTNLNSAVQVNAPPVPSGFSLVLENNGALNSSQSTLNLVNGSNITITDSGAGALSIAAASAASPAFMFGAGNFSFPASLAISGAAKVDQALRVYVHKFFTSAPLSFSEISFAAASNLAGGGSVNFGVYSTAGNLLFQSGAIAIPNIGFQNFDQALSPSWVLPGGSYYLAWTATDTGNTTMWGWLLANNYVDNGTSSRNLINRNGVVNFGYATNAATASAASLPSTLGALTAATNVGAGTPAVLFQ
jgi:hypothetical protein